jgi:predicted nucleic acid-binding protein
MVICADTSFLFSLYGNDVHTPRAIEWLAEQRTLLTISPLGEYELANALRFAEYSGRISGGEAARCWAEFEADRAAGRLEIRVCNLARIVEEAKRLSASYTLGGGHRGFDILHVAAALVLNAGQLLTFDLKQKELAEDEKLQVPL